MQISNDHGLLTIGENQCLGSLMHFKDHGVFDAEYGKVDVTPEDAEIHNKVLDEAMLKGLDENCKVGQGGTFYFAKNPMRVTTFIGTVVSSDVSKNGNSITFRRGGKTYRGREQKEADCFNFRRVK